MSESLVIVSFVVIWVLFLLLAAAIDRNVGIASADGHTFNVVCGLDARTVFGAIEFCLLLLSH